VRHPVASPSQAPLPAGWPAGRRMRRCGRRMRTRRHCGARL